MTPQAFLARFSAFGPRVMVLAVVLSVCTLAAYSASRRATRSPRLLWSMLLVDSLLAVAVFTLLPASGGGTAVNWKLGHGVDVGEFAANVALYIPAGFCLTRVLARRLLAHGLVILALVLPATVEALQSVLALGRISDVNDVLANGLGACAGLALSLRGSFREREHQQFGVGTPDEGADDDRGGKAVHARALPRSDG